jgi:hypothetical protein
MTSRVSTTNTWIALHSTFDLVFFGILQPVLLYALVSCHILGFALCNSKTKFLGPIGLVPTYLIVCLLCFYLVPDFFPCHVSQYNTLTILLTYSHPLCKWTFQLNLVAATKCGTSYKSKHDLKGIIKIPCMLSAFTVSLFSSLAF